MVLSIVSPVLNRLTVVDVEAFSCQRVQRKLLTSNTLVKVFQEFFRLDLELFFQLLCV